MTTRTKVLLGVSLIGLTTGSIASLASRPELAAWLWAGGTLPVILALAHAIGRALLSGKHGVDAIALLSMSVGLLLGETLAASVVAVMYSGGTFLEAYAVGRAERSLTALVDRVPHLARRREKTGVEIVSVDRISAGDDIVVPEGCILPVDGILISESAVIDESALTGESVPVQFLRGQSVRSGTLNMGNLLEMSATATAGESTYAGIVRIATSARESRGAFLRLADRFAVILLPSTLILAVGAWAISGEASRALAVLVSATPCPLILAAPVAFISGVARAARYGILIKGGGPMEALAAVRSILFDKTGTLTLGGTRVRSVEPCTGQDPDELLAIAASLEQASSHVTASAILQAASDRSIRLSLPVEVREAKGSGVSGRLPGGTARVGSYEYVAGAAVPSTWASAIIQRACSEAALCVFVALDGRLLGALLLGDDLRSGAKEVVHALRRLGISRIGMLTGDRHDVAEAIGGTLHLDFIHANRSPTDKVTAVEAECKRGITAMVGDGINDAPALARADVGIAMGARGSSASSEAADVVLLTDDLALLPMIVRIARRTRRIAMQSVAFGMVLSGAAMVAAACGWLTPISGALVQEAVDVAVILNALRALSSGQPIAGRRSTAAKEA